MLHREDSSPIWGFSQLEENSMENLDLAPTSTPKPTIRPKNHISALRKLMDRYVTVTRKWVVLGDLTAARFPTNSDQDL